jgi:hypothetical protein
MDASSHRVMMEMRPQMEKTIRTQREWIIAPMKRSRQKRTKQAARRIRL